MFGPLCSSMFYDFGCLFLFACFVLVVSVVCRLLLLLWFCLWVVVLSLAFEYCLYLAVLFVGPLSSCMCFALLCCLSSSPFF